MSITTIAQRLAKLKANTAEEAGLITYPIGALFYAFEAQRCNFTNRLGTSNRWHIELDGALAAATTIAKRKRPSTTDWVSIAHFNSALMRIDVGFERLLKHITSSKACDLATLIPLAKKYRVPASALQHWEKVRRYEVNRLKHHNPGALTKERLKFADMVKALEALVDLLERQL